MDLLEMVRNGLELIRQMRPGLKEAAEVTKSIGTLGGAVVYVLQQGKRLYTYLIGRQASENAAGNSEKVAPRADVAVLVDINRRMIQDVARYLQEKGIDANLVLITNDPQYGSDVSFVGVDEPEAWEELVREFNSAVGAVKRTLGASRYHIFLSTPLALAFGLGAVWGTVDSATIYHWQDGSYHPVMPISRRLRQ